MKDYDIVRLRREYLNAVRAMDSAEKLYVGANTSDREIFYRALRAADAAWEALEDAIRKDACPTGTGHHRAETPDSLGNVYCSLCKKKLTP